MAVSFRAVTRGCRFLRVEGPTLNAGLPESDCESRIGTATGRQSTGHSATCRKTCILEVVTLWIWRLAMINLAINKDT